MGIYGILYFIKVWNEDTKKLFCLLQVYEPTADGDREKTHWAVYEGNGVNAVEIMSFNTEADACKAFYYYIADLQKIERTPGEIRRIKFRRFFRIRFRRLKNLFRSGNV